MTEAAEIYHLLERLCASIGGETHKDEIFKRAKGFLSSNPSALTPYATDSVTSRIWNRLSQRNSNDASRFLEVHEILMSHQDQLSCHKILSFLDCLGTNSKQSSITNNNNSTNLNNNLSSLKHRLQTNYDSLQKLTDSPLFESPKIISSTLKPSAAENTMLEMIQEVIYALVGVQGKYLQKNVITGEFKLNVKQKGISKCHAVMMLRIAKVGYYHDLVKKYTNPKSGCYLRGLMGQGMVSALEKELSNYCGMVALLQEQLNRQKDGNSADPLTFIKLSCWIAEPLSRLKWLSDIAAACGSDAKGGKIVSVVYAFLSNGDKSVQKMVKDILVHMCKPLQHMLIRWLLDGEIEDPFDEFFIEELPDVELDRLWHEKYRIQKNRLPAFISQEVANKIFVTGKSINFLRAVCQDRAPYKNSEELKACFENNVEALFAPTNDTKLHAMIEKAYLDTSKMVLDVILGQHRLIENLQALKRYLLLGQGDFIGLLMQNLKQELDRPAKELLRHDLHSIMCTALRSSCAQFDDQEVLDNLDVKLLDPFDGDLGWDTFTLLYSVQGPLATMLRPCLDEYRIIFKPLWNIKRIEFVVFKVREEQFYNVKFLKSVGREIIKIRSLLHMITLEMVHFVHQMQYYTMFEVIECSWTALLAKINGANALDDVLASHVEFLNTIKTGIFLDQSANSLYIAMEAIFSTIMKLEKWQNNFYSVCQAEEKARNDFEAHIKQSEITGTFGQTTKSRLERDEAQKTFEGRLILHERTLDTINNEYKRYIREFIYKLTASQEIDLQLFGIRLDFNEYYKKNDTSLNAPLTFEHVRQSSVFYSRSFINGQI